MAKKIKIRSTIWKKYGKEISSNGSKTGQQTILKKNQESPSPKKQKGLLYWILFYPVLKAIAAAVLFCLPKAKNLKFIRFGYARTDRLGELVPQMALYLATRKEEYLDLWFFTHPYCNTVIVEKIKALPEIRKWRLGENLFHIIYKKLRSQTALQEFCIVLHNRDVKNEIRRKPSFLKMTKKETQAGYKFLERRKIKKTDPFVCLHVRDSRYLKNLEGPEAEEIHTYRNSEISNYKKAIQWLCKKRIHVFRMGKDQSQKMLINNKYFHDYAFLEERSDLLDLFLGTRCYFVITTCSGWDSIPIYSFKRVLITNLFPIYDFPSFYKKCFMIFKKYFSKKERKHLNLREIHDRGLRRETSKAVLDLKGVVIQENSQDEILEAVKETYHYKKILNMKSNRIAQKTFLREFKKFAFNQNTAVDHQNFCAQIGFSFYTNNANLLKYE